MYTQSIRLNINKFVRLVSDRTEGELSENDNTSLLLAKKQCFSLKIIEGDGAKILIQILHRVLY